MEKIELIKVATVQASPFFLDRERTLEKACKLIQSAAENGAKLVVFPESFIPGYPDWVWLVANSHAPMLNELYAKLVQNSVTIPDDTTHTLCEAAKLSKIHVAIGLCERNSELSNSSLFNTLLFIDDNGQISGKRRKLIPTGGERMIWSQGDGSTLKIFNTSIGKIGGLICWENYMPLARQAIYNGGAQILAAPTWDKSENWLQSLRFIAREGGLFVIGSCMSIKIEDIPDSYEFKNLYPEGREWINIGNSCIINPKGEFIAGPLEKTEGILYAELDFNEILQAKRIFDSAGHYSRPDVFHFEINSGSVK